jgi:hypothetical protein
MRDYTRVYRKALSRLLSSHAEQGVPEDVDLWPTIQERLAQRGALDETRGQHGRVGDARLLQGNSPRSSSAVARTGAGWLRLSIGVASMVGLLLLVGLGWFALSRQAVRPPIKTTVLDVPTKVEAAATATATVPVGSNATPTQVPKSPPVALSRDGDGFRLDVYDGTARFGSSAGSPWVDPSRLLVEWYSNPQAPASTYTYSTFLIDTSAGTLLTLPGQRPNRDVYPSPDGNKLLMLWQGPGLHLVLYDLQTGITQTVADLDPDVPQWAGPEVNLSEFQTGTEIFVFVKPQWVDSTNLAITLSRSTQAGDQYNFDKVLMVDIVKHQVNVLANRGTVMGVFSGSVLLRLDRIDGAVQLFRPGNKSPRTVAASGPWTEGWSVSPDGQRIAWLELTPPPGDWSEHLPSECCGSDPAPTVKSIVVLDHEGIIRRYDIRNFAWSSPDGGWAQSAHLKWSKDSSAIFYAVHPTVERTTLMRLPLDGQATSVVELDKRVGLDVVAQGDDDSTYYTINGMDCQNCAQLMHLWPDGRQEVVHTNSVPFDWYVDERGRLEMLKDGGVLFMDFATGQSHQVNFPGVQISTSDMSWTPVGGLVPISPDSQWAAYAGSQSDIVITGPDGRPDRGRTVYIAKIK